MIDNLEIGSFRAFRSERFDFTKLNIFVGPNNSGKSSALSALNVLAQTTNNGFMEAGPIVLNGQFDQLGTFKDMVHGGRASTPVKLSFGVRGFSVSFEIKYRTQRREAELTKFKLSRDGVPVYEYTLTKNRYDILLNGRNIESLPGKPLKRKPRFDGFIPIGRDFFVAQRRLLDKGEKIDEDTSLLFKTVDRDLFRFRREVTELFSGFDSLGPFRDMPQRTYLYSGESAEHIGRTGVNTVSLLASDSSKRGSERVGFVDEITKWMRATGIASGVRVKNLTERHFEIAVVGQDGTDHNICDVGFGCSQVMPVLVAGVRHALMPRRSRGSTLIIQEPEIHLHPNAQAALGSFFANLVSAQGQVFIETHSDNLVLRVARHVALGDVRPDDVKIFYVEDRSGFKKVHEILINENGSFAPEWPGGFFPQRQEESFELARAAMSGSRNEEPSQLDFKYPG